MDFKEYQKQCLPLRLLNNNSKKELIARFALGVAGEGGEVAEKVKKYLRGDYTEILLKVHLEKELGDVLFYCAVLADMVGLDLGEIASRNIKKLTSRKRRGELKGSGDNR